MKFRHTPKNLQRDAAFCVWGWQNPRVARQYEKDKLKSVSATALIDNFWARGIGDNQIATTPCSSAYDLLYPREWNEIVMNGNPTVSWTPNQPPADKPPVISRRSVLSLLPSRPSKPPLGDSDPEPEALLPRPKFFALVKVRTKGSRPNGMITNMQVIRWWCLTQHM